MHKFFPIAFLLFLFGCGGEESSGLTEEEIDAYVESCLDTSNVYDILAGLRYSRNDESYQVTEYGQNDTTVLFSAQEMTEYSTVMMNYYYKDAKLVYIEEFNYQYSPEHTEVLERKLYMDGEVLVKAYERRSELENEIDEIKFEEVDIDLTQYDLDRPKRAIKQEQEYELKYGEFLIIDPESYLILENDESGYGVALYIIEKDMLLDEMFNNPTNYRGKTIEVFHEFLMMNGIERMIYRGGIVKD